MSEEKTFTDVLGHLFEASTTNPLTEKGKRDIFDYFTGYEKRQADALSFFFLLSTVHSKLEYLRALIRTPGMFSHRFNQSIKRYACNFFICAVSYRIFKT